MNKPIVFSPPYTLDVTDKIKELIGNGLKNNICGICKKKVRFYHRKACYLNGNYYHNSCFWDYIERVR